MKWARSTARALADRKGTTALEYAIMLVAMGVPLLGVIYPFATAIRDAFIRAAAF